MPADSVAPSGTPLMVTERVSEPSVRAAVMSRSMAVSSAPEAAETLRSGASATPVTVTSMVPVVVALSVPSVDVAVTDSEKVPLKSSAGLSFRVARSFASTVHVPAGPSVPADSVAPSGTPLMVTERVSEPSVSTSEEEISSAMAVSSAPVAAPVS